MKKYLFLIGSLIATGALAKVLPQPAIPAKLAAQNLLTDITLVGNSTLAVGKWGNIVYSKDSNTWQQANTPVQSLLTAVYFVDSQLGWAVGHDATILHTQDGGQNWHIQQYLPELDKPLLDILFFDKKHGLAIGAYGLTYRTTDGGKTWQKEFYDSLLYEEDREYLNDLKESDPEGYQIETQAILPHFNKLYLDGETLWLVGELGLMATSSDMGKTWQRLDEIYAGSFFSFNKLNNQYLVGGLRGTAFTSTDGVEWTQLETNTTASINNIEIVADKAIFLANSGVWLTYSDNQITKSVTKDGKSLMAGALNQNGLIIASESGIHKLSVQ
ncbi:WD40/YVTN/BNR-like repeat-containing protein [Pseudoalteromonas sp. G4]|uniref:WD40/YVTN/BNR-like repeat-containing protein n=1 Tax=Pseudoalteromonas sp. G4 TaxID=2992761 RepID=UPI00237DF3F1|nr:YCF48-related protein [Pseudoalteromonas sp. G4]MDE3273248.1 YCF48-related protein [Pseudoalteromonas sp. G4]